MLNKIIRWIFNLLKPWLPSGIQKKIGNADVELLNGSIVFFITKVVGIGLTYLFAWFVTHEMGAGKWGFITLMITTINMFSILSTFGLDTVIIKHTSKEVYSGSLASLQKIYQQVMLLIMAILTIFVTFVALNYENLTVFLYGRSSLSPYFTLAMFGVVANVFFQINNAVLAGMKEMVSYGIYKNILLFGLGLIVYLIGYHTIYPIIFARFMESGILLLFSYVGVIYFGLLLNTIQVFRKVGFPNSSQPISFTKKQLLKEGFPLMLAASMTIVLTTTDYFMLSHFKSQNEVGLYDIAVKISIVTATILMAVGSIATPKFSEFYSQKDFNSLKKIARQSGKLIFLGSTPILLIIMLFPSQILSLFGEEFVIASNALIFLTLGQFVNAVSGLGGNMLKMTDQQNILRNIILLATVLNGMMNYWLIPDYGITGAAIASCVSICMLHICSATYVYQKLKVKTFYIPFVS